MQIQYNPANKKRLRKKLRPSNLKKTMDRTISYCFETTGQIQKVVSDLQDCTVSCDELQAVFCILFSSIRMSIATSGINIGHVADWGSDQNEVGA